MTILKNKKTYGQKKHQKNYKNNKGRARKKY
jgi:hypothetical protein